MQDFARHRNEELMAFGTALAMRPGSRTRVAVPASDYFSSDSWSGVYRRTVPLHALKRIAIIEKVVPSGTVMFMVSDYATLPAVQPDPFLMAVVPNRDIAQGVGRFIIDFWDEPGFGIEQMLSA